MICGVGRAAGLVAGTWFAATAESLAVVSVLAAAAADDRAYAAGKRSRTEMEFWRTGPLTAVGHWREWVGDSLPVGPTVDSTASIAVAGKYELSATTELRVNDNADITVPNRLCSRYTR